MHTFCNSNIVLAHSYRNCIAFAFAGLLQKEIGEFALYWNSHCIRKNAMAECPNGIPQDMYDIPAHYGKRFLSLHGMIVVHIYLCQNGHDC